MFMIWTLVRGRYLSYGAPAVLILQSLSFFLFHGNQLLVRSSISSKYTDCSIR